MMNDSQHHQNGNRVCVVGAGIAGLVTAKVMQEDGFDVTLFERSGDIGGVWNPARVYSGLKANNSRLTYAFSDFPYPDTADEFPTAPQIYAYLHAYMQHFNLEPLLHLSSTGTSISRSSNRDKGRFKVVVQPTDETGTAETHFFDFVAICNGVHSELNLPSIAPPPLPNTGARPRWSFAQLTGCSLAISLALQLIKSLFRASQNFSFLIIGKVVVKPFCMDRVSFWSGSGGQG
jgi:hypothetical protein